MDYKEKCVNMALTLLGSAEVNVIDTLYYICEREALTHTHRDEMEDKLTPVIVSMIIERYNRIGSEGVSSQSFSGVSESFINGYSETIIKQLNKLRRVVSL